MTDYRSYALSGRERAFGVALGCFVCFIAIGLLYHHFWIATIGSLAGLLYPRLLKRRLCRNRQDRLRLHFKEALHGLSSLLAAGRSVESAFALLERDLAYLLGEGTSDLLKELRTIANRMRNGEPLEQPLRDLAVRSGVEDIANFAEVFVVCKRSGGDMVEVIRRTSQLIGEKLEVELEMTVLMAQKRFESKFLMAMPFAFVGLLGFFAPDYMAALRQGAGLALLTGGLALLGFCCWWIARIMAIRV